MSSVVRNAQVLGGDAKVAVTARDANAVPRAVMVGLAPQVKRDRRHHHVGNVTSREMARFHSRPP